MGIVTREGLRGASASTSSAPAGDLEDLTDESTTVTDLPMGPRGTRDALNVRTLGLVPLKEMRAAPELLFGFADAFSSLRAVSSLSDLLWEGLGEFRLLFGRIVKERGSVCEVFGVGFAFAAVLEDFMVAATNGDRATV